jgi:hypothetical protein
MKEFVQRPLYYQQCEGVCPSSGWTTLPSPTWKHGDAPLWWFSSLCLMQQLLNLVLVKGSSVCRTSSHHWLLCGMETMPKMIWEISFQRVKWRHHQLCSVCLVIRRCQAELPRIIDKTTLGERRTSKGSPPSPGLLPHHEPWQSSRIESNVSQWTPFNAEFGYVTFQGIKRRVIFSIRWGPKLYWQCKPPTSSHYTHYTGLFGVLSGSSPGTCIGGAKTWLRHNLHLIIYCEDISWGTGRDAKERWKV